jgi:uncharacterized SAM-binding protein YcdF (DUF218 family)
MIDPTLLGRRVVETLILPPCGLLWLLGLSLWWMRRRPRSGWIATCITLALSWLTCTPGAGYLLGSGLEGTYPSLDAESFSATLSGTDPPRAIVVLAGGSVHDPREWPWSDRPSDVTMARMIHGARLARLSGLPVLVSGGRVQVDRPPEAEAMARMSSEALGVEPRWVERRSLDTAGNARESARLLEAAGIHSIVLVTSARRSGARVDPERRRCRAGGADAARTDRHRLVQAAQSDRPSAKHYNGPLRHLSLALKT